MAADAPSTPKAASTEAVLHAYLLGSVEFESVQAFQRRLVYQVSGDRDLTALVLCEHPPLISVGRHGSRAHILYEPAELTARLTLMVPDLGRLPRLSRLAFVGVREVGAHYRRGYKVALVLRCRLEGDRLLPPEAGNPIPTCSPP